MTDTTDEARHTPPRPGRGSGRAPFILGFVLSALAHAVLIAVYPFFGAAIRDSLRPALPADPSAVTGTRVIQVVEIETDPSTSPDDPADIETVDEPEASLPEVDISDPRPRFPDRYRSAAERLRAGQGDARLWQPLDPSVGEPTPEDVARLRLLTAIESMNDSAMIEAERERRATDWTYTDDEGNRWGVSPGRLHLGSVSIPLPFGFGPPPDYDGEGARRAFEYSDIDRAAGARAVRESWKDRRDAMRERREQRRAEEEEADEEARERSRVRPDTTGIVR